MLIFTPYQGKEPEFDWTITSCQNDEYMKPDGTLGAWGELTMGVAEYIASLQVTPMQSFQHNTIVAKMRWVVDNALRPSPTTTPPGRRPLRTRKSICIQAHCILHDSVYEIHVPEDFMMTPKYTGVLGANVRPGHHGAQSIPLKCPYPHEFALSTYARDEMALDFSMSLRQKYKVNELIRKFTL